MTGELTRPSSEERAREKNPNVLFSPSAQSRSISNSPRRAHHVTVSRPESGNSSPHRQHHLPTSQLRPIQSHPNRFRARGLRPKVASYRDVNIGMLRHVVRRTKWDRLCHNCVCFLVASIPGPPHRRDREHQPNRSHRQKRKGWLRCCLWLPQSTKLKR